VKNMERYAYHLEWSNSLESWKNLKYLDESHIISKSLVCKQALSLKGCTLHVIDTHGLTDFRFMLMIITKLDNGEDYIYSSVNGKTNSQYEFLDFLVQTIDDKALVSGKTLF